MIPPRYVLLIPHADSYLVQPVGNWWKYKKHKEYTRTLNTEEAEKLMEETPSLSSSGRTNRA